MIRTVKSVLENDPKLMPPSKICGSCPSTEYKKLKKKNRRRRETAETAEEVCTKNGEGVFEDPTDCTRYYICRSISSPWGEKKHEKCYTGSYFDKSGKQCKWVGEGNYNCDNILGKSSGDDSDTNDGGENPKPEKSKSENAQDSDIVDDSEFPTSKKWFDLKNAKLIPETVIPPEQYTCKAPKNENIEQDIDYLKCFSCEDGGKCSQYSNNATSSTSSCDSKTHKCYSKALYNANNQMVSFTKGCAAIRDLEQLLNQDFSQQSGADQSNDFESSQQKKKKQVMCVKKNKNMKVCYDVCDTNYCNARYDFQLSSSNLIQINKMTIFLFNLIFFFIKF